MMQAEAFLGAARDALAAFGVTPARLRPVAISENVVFHVDEEAARRALCLRLHRPDYHSAEELVSERIWTRALRHAGAPVPAGLTGPGGADFVWVRTDEPAVRAAGLTIWEEGEALSQVLERTRETIMEGELYRRLGELIGRLHAHAFAWRIPQGFTRPRRDLDGLLGESSSWGRFWEHERLSADERRLLLRAHSQLERVLSSYGTSQDVFGLIHADLHPGNVLVTEDGLFAIDFDDAAFSWRLADIATCLFHLEPGDRRDRLILRFIDGYSAVCALDVDQGLLDCFHALRALALIGWLHQRPELNSEERFDGIRLKAVAACARLGL